MRQREFFFILISQYYQLFSNTQGWFHCKFTATVLHQFMCQNLSHVKEEFVKSKWCKCKLCLFLFSSKNATMKKVHFLVILFLRSWNLLIRGKIFDCFVSGGRSVKGRSVNFSVKLQQTMEPFAATHRFHRTTDGDQKPKCCAWMNSQNSRISIGWERLL